MSRVGLLVFLISVLIPRAVFATPVLNTSLALQEEQYSLENSPAQRFDLGARVRSEDTLEDSPQTPVIEGRLFAFYESGMGGDHSVDVDTSVVRIPLSAIAHLWAGRTHPLADDYNRTQASRTDAIGANWVQNQSDALDPRVSGWVGTGFHLRSDSGLALSATYSPLFLPSFGPRIDYSSSQDSNGSRFARLPPQCVLINGQCLPLRYVIKVGDVRDIVLQNQAFASVGYESKLIDAHAMFWSAPNPNPSVDTQAALHFQSEQDLNVLVTAKPHFERQDFAGFEFSLPSLLIVPTFAGAYETRTRQITASAQLDFFERFKFGYLTSFNTPPSDSPVFTPQYADRLIWGEFTQPVASWLRPSLRIEEHLVPGATDHWIHPKVDVLVDRKTTLFASASILAGSDASYFGTWRALDSVSFGGKYQW